MLYFSHATGFCKEVWAAAIEELGDCDVVAWDYPAHGSGPSASHPIDWWDMARYALDQVAGPTPRIGIGHSMGATTLVMAELLAPDTFERLVLIEPIIFPGPKQRFTDTPLALASRRRRQKFANREAAYALFGSKSAFARWDRRALAGYVEGGLRPEGDHFVLSCSPEDEAEVFEMAGSFGAFDRLGEIAVPTHIVAGENSMTHSAEVVAALVQAFPNAKSTIVADATHFVPMEQPTELANLIRKELAAASPA